jgi:hypothetical protein
VGVGAGFWILRVFLGGAFIVFVAYEAVGMIVAFSLYVFLAISKRVAGAATVSAGIGLSVIAASIQASRLSVRLVVPFDHNGLFHVFQMIAIVTIASGIRKGLEAAPDHSAG